MLSGDYIATPLSLPLPHAGEVVECYPGVEALRDASRPHLSGRMSLPREYSVLLYLYLYLNSMYLPVPPGQVVVVGVLLKSHTHKCWATLDPVKVRPQISEVYSLENCDSFLKEHFLDVLT